MGALLIAFAAKPEELIGSATFQFARALAYALINVYVVKMAGVFMVTTSTIAIYTAIAPRWLAFFGYALAILLLFGASFFAWSFVVFPLWVFLLSLSILADNFRRATYTDETIQRRLFPGSVDPTSSGPQRQARELIFLFPCGAALYARRRSASSCCGSKPPLSVDLLAHDCERPLIDWGGIPRLDGREIGFARLISRACLPAMGPQKICR